MTVIQLRRFEKVPNNSAVRVANDVGIPQALPKESMQNMRKSICSMTLRVFVRAKYSNMYNPSDVCSTASTCVIYFLQKQIKY